MKVLKLVLGIVCIVLCVFVILQSCAATALNALEDKGEVDVISGIFVALLMLAGGIVLIATRKQTGKGGSVAGLILFALAALLGFANAKSFADLNIWAGLCAAIAVVCLIDLFIRKAPKQTPPEETQAPAP